VSEPRNTTNPRSSLHSAHVDFMSALLRFPLRSRSAHNAVESRLRSCSYLEKG